MFGASHKLKIVLEGMFKLWPRKACLVTAIQSYPYSNKKLVTFFVNLGNQILKSAFVAKVMSDNS